MNISIVANIFISLFIIAIGVYIPFALIKSKSILTEAIELQNYVHEWDFLYENHIYHESKRNSCIICGRPTFDNEFICSKCQSENN